MTLLLLLKMFPKLLKNSITTWKMNNLNRLNINQVKRKNATYGNLDKKVDVVKMIKEVENLLKRAEELRKSIRKKPITQDDIQTLRSIQPPRKSVQNLLEKEVAQTTKFESLMSEHMGARSPYEMRKNGDNQPNDAEKRVPVIQLGEHEIPSNLSEIRGKEILSQIKRGTFENTDIGAKIDFGKKSIDEIISKAMQDKKRGNSVTARICALYDMQEIIKNAVCFDSLISEYNSETSKNKSPNSMFMHNMYAVANHNGNFYLIGLEIEESYVTDRNDNFKGTSSRLYSLRDTEITPVEANRIFSPTVGKNNFITEDTSTGVTSISISQLYELVKSLDENFHENLQSPGRAERETELLANAEYLDAVQTVQMGRKVTENADRQSEKIKQNRSTKDEQAKENSAKLKKKYSRGGDVIIGNVPFRYIPKKTYTKIEQDILEDVTKKLEESGMKFSGVIKSDGVTLTTSETDKAKLDSIIEEVRSVTKNNSVAEQQTEKEKVATNGNSDNTKNVPETSDNNETNEQPESDSAEKVATNGNSDNNENEQPEQTPTDFVDRIKESVLNDNSVRNAALNSDDDMLRLEIKTKLENYSVQTVTKNPENYADDFDNFSGNVDGIADKTAEEIFQTAIKFREEERKKSESESAEKVATNGNSDTQYLYSVQHLDDMWYFKVSEDKLNDVLKISGEEMPFPKLMEFGEPISIEEYAEIQQSDRFGQSIAVNFDDYTAEYYTVNNGKGGFSDGDRTDENTVFETVEIPRPELKDRTEKEEVATNGNSDTQYLYSGRFTKLSNEDKQFIDAFPETFISEPVDTPWGKTQECHEIAKGVFEVSTAGHGGVMIREELAEHMLSPEALEIGFVENGYHCYEEDADAQVPLRELFDKDIVDIQQYVSERYVKSYEEIGEWLNTVINETNSLYHPNYWAAHESAKDKLNAEMTTSENGEKTEQPESESAEKVATNSNSDVPEKNFQHENVEIVEKPARPTITCEWSESPFFEEGKTYSVAEFDKIMSDADRQKVEGYKKNMEVYGNADLWLESDEDSYYNFIGYDKVKFNINLPDGRTVTERQDVGDGYGGVIDFLKKFGYNQEAAVLEDDIKKYPLENADKNGELSEPKQEKAAPTVSDSEVNDKIIEEEVPETVEVSDDKNPELREVLNRFSAKHGLGELNVEPSNYTWKLKEKFSDGTDFLLGELRNSEYGMPFTPDELSKSLENFERQIQAKGQNIAEIYSRESFAKNHGGVSKLPKVPDSLPEIRYAKKPYEKISGNIAAIREMLRLEKAEENGETLYDKRSNQYNSKQASEHRLRQYCGWGGLPQIFDERFKQYEYQRAELKKILTPEEYQSARASTTDAHYTPQIIIDAMYKAVQNMDLPRNARILEPSCGTGNFISRLPHKFSDAEVVGVEIDSVTARIAKQLNRENDNVKIVTSGFEETDFRNNSFDLAIGNVPFGEQNLHDSDYKQDWKIHDSFFRKALDKVAPGGVVAFVTSSGTMDKNNPKIREYLAERAELVGAIRLPNNAFSEAGTGVTADIIFLKKREKPLQPDAPKPDWCYTTPNSDGLKINSYFVKNPQMVLGTMERTTFHDRLTCKPFENSDLEKLLNDAIKNLNAKITVTKREKEADERRGMIEPWGKNFTFQIKDDKVFYRNGADMKEVKMTDSEKEKLKMLCKIRDLTRRLIDLQKTEISDEKLVPLRESLNRAYDEFGKKFGIVSSRETAKLFGDDSDYPIVKSLECYDKENENYQKADIFSKRTVNPVAEIKSVETAEEALQVSLDRKGKPDIPYMADLLGKTAENVCDELLRKGYIFIDPEKRMPDKPFSGVTERSEYLSENIRCFDVFSNK